MSENQLHPKTKNAPTHYKAIKDEDALKHYIHVKKIYILLSSVPSFNNNSLHCIYKERIEFWSSRYLGIKVTKTNMFQII